MLHDFWHAPEAGKTASASDVKDNTAAADHDVESWRGRVEQELAAMRNQLHEERATNAKLIETNEELAQRLQQAEKRHGVRLLETVSPSAQQELQELQAHLRTEQALSRQLKAEAEAAAQSVVADLGHKVERLQRHERAVQGKQLLVMQAAGAASAADYLKRLQERITAMGSFIDEAL